jgi:hypothetical protein
MAIVMNMVWDGVTPEQYDQVRELVNWENDRPVGANFHVASFDRGALRVTDMWDSAEDFQRFVEARLMPGVQQIGIAGEPDVTITEVHRTYTPAFQPA